MEVTIRLAQESDFPAYLHLMQRTYQDSFVNEALGLTKECFSEEVFQSLTSRKFFGNLLRVTDKQKCWLAFIGEELVGSITMTDEGEIYDLGGFYVAKKYQGMGIGKKLLNLAFEYAKGKDITLGVYTHNTKAIELYKKLGFVVDSSKEIRSGHWPDWPEGLEIKTLYMRYKEKSIGSN